MIRRIDHIGLVVSNIENSIRFYEEILEMKLKRRLTLVGEGIAKVKELNGPAKVDIAVLELNNNYIELLEFKSPKGSKIEHNRIMPNQYGEPHIAFEVENIEKIYNSLKNNGINFTSIPRQMIAERKEEKCSICTFFRDPDGILLEILQRKKK